ncbi:MAG: 5'/3'-nucleotidase SurE [Halohasta sp.]
MDEPTILLTNDDGIDSVGFRALYEGLSDCGEVIAVAPANDQSAVGRTISEAVDIREHKLGYEVEGTPVDCVIAGLGTLCPEADLVVSGCNKGANIGAYVLGRSGTVSAAVEAAFFEVPAISVSLYIDGGDDWAQLASEPEDFRHATAATRYLVDRAGEAGVFEAADYLNVNVPYIETDSGVRDPSGMVVTHPSTRYEMGAERDGEQVALRDGIWELMRSGSITDPEGTDRRAVAEGKISVSPLTAPHSTERHSALDRLVDAY